MRTKSLTRASCKSLDPQSRNRIEKSEGCEEEMVRDKKRNCGETSNENEKGRFEVDACIVCEVSDMLVTRCCGADCFVSFHGECLNSECGGGVDVSNPFCPYCWYKFLAMKSESLLEEANEAGKAMCKYLDIDMKEKLLPEETEQREEEDVVAGLEEQDAKDNDETVKVDFQERCVGKKGKEHDQVIQNEKQSSRRRVRKRVELNDDTDSKSGDMEEEEVVASGDQEMVHVENLEDSEHDDETAIGKVKSGAGESYSGKEHENESSRKRRQVVLDDDSDSEISSTKEPNEEDVTEQQRKLGKATTKVDTAKSKTPREVPFTKKEQRRRILWTSKEEEILKAGVLKFAAEANKNIPWRKILKMGENVFHETRSSSDLKDKWRNMIKLM